MLDYGLARQYLTAAGEVRKGFEKSQAAFYNKEQQAFLFQVLEPPKME